MAHVIGCDVGSQSLKGVLVDTEGANVADASASYELSFPQPGGRNKTRTIGFGRCGPSCLRCSRGAV